MSALGILCTYYSKLSTILNISILHANVSDSLMDVFKVGNFKVFKVGNFKVFKVLKLEKEHSCTEKMASDQTVWESENPNPRIAWSCKNFVFI
jgi:hypothetical protein